MTVSAMKRQGCGEKRQGCGESFLRRAASLCAVLAFVLVFSAWAPVAQAATSEFSLLMDLDDQPASGCSVATVDGAFDGVEQILVTTVDNSTGDPQVISVATRDCVDPGTNTFGAPVIVDMPYAPPWPVAVDDGTNGSDGIESYWPAQIDPNQRFIRVAAISSEDGDGEEDAILDLGLVEVGGLSVLEIPTLGTWGLFGLALVLSFFALRILRRYPSTAASMVAVLLLVSAAGAVWAGAGMFMPDGDLSEWAPISPLGSDGAGDAGPDADLIAVFAAVDETQPGLLFVRFDAVLNDCPTAVDDAVATDADAVLGGDVLADNGSGADSDPEGQGLTVTAVDGNAADVGTQITLASGALLTVNANGTFSYDPNGQFDPLAPGESATDGFSYTVEDDLGCADGADVTITVNGVNDCPTAVDDAVTTDEDTLLNGDVTLDNGSGPDTDPKGDSLVVTEVNGNAADVGVQITLPSGALLTVNSDGTFAYDPNGQFEALGAGESDTDTFTYTIDDGSGTCSETATVTVTITGINDCPTAVDDAVITDQDTVLNGDVTAANPTTPDSDPESDTLVVTEVDGNAANVGVQITLASGALLTLNSDGTFAYDPNGQFDDLGAGDSDTDSFTYTIDDGSGTCSETATVTVTITGVNDCPTAVDDAASTDEDSVLNGDVTAANPTTADSDPDGDPLTVTEVNGNAANVGVQITLASGALLTVNANGTFSYDPNGAFDSLGDGDTDTDSFTYTLDDGSGTCSETATVTITINGLNTCPVAVDDAVSTDEDTALNGDVLAANPTTPDSDADGDPMTVTAVNGNAANVGVQITLGSGALLTVNANGTFSYDPNGAFDTLGAGATDTDSFTYTIDDGSGTCAETATVTVTINGVNDCPTAVNDAVSTDENTAVNGNVTAANPTTADSDPEGDSLTVTAVNGNAANVGVQIALGSGLLTVNANGTFTFDPNGGYETLGPGDMAQEMFTYTIDDGSGACAETATVTITINGVNDIPMVVGESFDTVANTLLQVAASQTQTPSVFVAGNLLSNDSDPDGPAALTASLNTATAGAVVTVNSDGTFTYLPPAGLTGSDSFTYDVSDGSTTVAGTVDITFVGRVWYIENDAAAGGLGRSSDPFDTLAEAGAAHGANDMICVRTGDGSTAGHTSGVEISFTGVLLHGEHHGCEPNVSLNGNPAPTSLVAASAGNHPMIDHTGGGVGVQVMADSGDLTGIFIRGLNIDGDDNAIDVTSTAGHRVDVTVENNIVRAAGDDGIDVNHNSTATDSRVVISGNSLAAADDAAELRTTNGALEVEFDNNTDITGGLNGVVINGSGGGTLTVSSFAGNSVHQDTVENGIVMNSVVLDADGGTGAGGDADFTGDTVVAGDTAVGAIGDGVGDSGILLTNVTGDLSFGDLDVVADGGAGLMATAAGPLNAGAGTGFRLATGAGTSLAATGGPALDLDPLTAAITVSSLASTNSSSTGVSLDDISGTVSIGGGSIVNPSGFGLRVDGAAPIVSYGGSITSAATTAVQVTNTTGGSVTVDNGTLSTDGGAFAAIAAVNTDGAVNITNMTVSHSNGRVISFNDVDGGSSFAGTTISTTNHHGISVQNSAGSHTFPNMVIAGGTPSPVDAVFLNANSSATINFSRVAVSTTGAGVRGLVATNSGTVNVTDNTSTISSTGGPAVVINPTSVGMTFASVSSANSNGAGISLTGVTGSFVANGGTIGSAAGVAIDIDAGSGTKTIDSNVTNSAARSVEVTNHGAGTVTIGGTITDTGNGVLLDNNDAATLVFDGAMDLDTGTVDAFTAINGGTVNVLDPTTSHSLSTTTGRALRVDNTTIGAMDMTFRDISANGAPSGIVLVNTGTSGGLTVTGDGTDTTQGGNSSGGLIRNTTGTAVLVDQSHELNLARMRILTPGGHGILADQLSGQGSLMHTTVEDVDVANTSAVFLRNDNVNLNAGTGFTTGNSIFRNAVTGQVMYLVEGRGTSLMNVTVENSLFEDLAPDAFQHSAGLDPGDNGTITSVFRNNTVRNARAAVGSSVINIGKAHSANSAFTISGNTIQNVGIPGVNGGVINIAASAANVGGTITGTISGNRLENVQGRRRGINVVPEPASGSVGTVDVTITDNDINDMTNGIGIFVDIRENTPLTHLRVTNNRIGTGNFGTTAGNMGGTRDGVFIQADDTQAKTLNVLFEDNTIHVTNVGTGTSSDQAAVIKADNDNCTVNATVQGNTIIQGAGGTGDFVFEAEGASTYCLDLNAANVGADANAAATGIVLEREAAATFHVEGMAAGPHTNAVVEAFLDPRNSNHVLSPVGGGFTNNGGAGCPTPP
ncbi:MAG: Ig-like domain-containing protein [Acidobacteriota bacterium]